MSRLSRLSDPTAVRRAARFAGPVVAVVVYLLLPETYLAEGVRVAFSHAGRTTAALAAWMALWWLTEAIEIPATALLPLVVLPVVGAGSIREVAAPYAHDLIFFFMGGFILSIAMQRWALHRRIALVTLSIVGTSPPRIVAGFMVATAGLSMWLSNTATTIMMLPIALSVVAMVGDRQGDAASDDRHRLSVCLMLGIAYAASIGGVGTIIGSPPNLFLVSYVREALGRDITFAQWMAMGLPLVLVFLPITWWLLTRVLFPLPSRALDGADAIRAACAALKPMSAAERAVAVVFGAAALAWIGRAWLTGVTVAGVRPLAGLTDAGIAMTAALSLFIIPARSTGAGAVMRWRDLEAMPWGILVLFGGGLSLAAAIQANGVDAFLGRQAAAWQGMPSWLIIVLVTTVVIFLTELTSNTATAATFVPILGGVAPGLGVHPYLLIVPAALAASWAFMLPVATPPNAIVFGSGHVSVSDMRRAGLRLNIAGVVVLTGLAYFVALPLLGVPLA
ncbi:MAG: SLC13 family permease [Vicinamibacterales bacterium]|nr:SLC13 family permease [Vicinamibacterales bacterium]